MLSLFLIISALSTVISLYLSKKNILKAILEVLSISSIAIMLIMLQLSDGQDYEKYYNLISKKDNLSQALNFYSFEYIFWSLEFYLAKLGPEFFRDANYILILLFPLIYFSRQEEALTKFNLFIVIQWFFPGTALLFGNALRQHLMIIVFLTLFFVFKTNVSRLFVVLISTLIHKSAILTLPFISLIQGKRIFFILLTAGLISVISLFDFYNEIPTSTNAFILPSYFIAILLISIMLKESKLNLISVAILLINFVSPIIAERLMLVLGPILAFYLAAEKHRAKLTINLIILGIIIFYLFILFNPLQSINILYKSIL